jgi:hypothetical protein
VLAAFSPAKASLFSRDEPPTGPLFTPMFLGRYETPFARNFFDEERPGLFEGPAPEFNSSESAPYRAHHKKEAGLLPGLRVTHEFLSLLS